MTFEVKIVTVVYESQEKEPPCPNEGFCRRCVSSNLFVSSRQLVRKFIFYSKILFSRIKSSVKSSVFTKRICVWSYETVRFHKFHVKGKVGCLIIFLYLSNTKLFLTIINDIVISVRIHFNRKKGMYIRNYFLRQSVSDSVVVKMRGNENTVVTFTVVSVFQFIVES